MGNKLIVGVNDLKSVNPELAAEWNYEKNEKLLPEMISANSGQKVWWKGKCGHEWDSEIRSRNRGSGCPICSGHRALNGFNDLASRNPELAAEWHPTKNGDLKPSDVTVGSNKKVWWYGKCGHEWQARISHRRLGTGCPICSSKKVNAGVNDLLSNNPVLATEWNYEKNGSLTPDAVSPCSEKMVWWRCKNGHEWEAVISSRNHGYGCPYCSGRFAIKGVNDLQTLNPTLASEWNYEKNGDLKPSDIMLNTNKKIWWKCDKGHEWQASPNSRTRAESGCPYCSGRIAIKGKNDLRTINPDLASEWDYTKNGKLLPSEVMPNSGLKVWWKGKCGHEWNAVIASRNRGYGCPICNESHLEVITRKILQKYDYYFKEQVVFEGLIGIGGKNLSYDFATYEDDKLDALIECQGGQHYEPIDYFGGMEQYKIQLEHDRLKQDFCQRNHILLIEIPYTYSDEEIEAIFSR